MALGPLGTAACVWTDGTDLTSQHVPRDYLHHHGAQRVLLKENKPVNVSALDIQVMLLVGEAHEMNFNWSSPKCESHAGTL